MHQLQTHQATPYHSTAALRQHTCCWQHYRLKVPSNSGVLLRPTTSQHHTPPQGGSAAAAAADVTAGSLIGPHMAH
jgi:hypothetical protein